MRRVTETTFVRQVLRAELPAIVCFGARACPGLSALRPALRRIEATYAGRLLVATVQLDDATYLAEQYGVAASPTLMVFAHGERQSQVVGFIADGLLELLAEDVAQGIVAGDGFWSPVEERFEDAVLLPLLRGWGLSARRQVTCALPGGNAAQRGRIDLLVYDDDARPPIALIESKRQIADAFALRQAAAQGFAYARSLGLATFFVAAPRGLWAYRSDAQRATLVEHITSLELHAQPARARGLLLRLVASAS